MKIYRLYYVEQEYIPSGYTDMDGSSDDYYDQIVDKEYTVGYFASTKAINKWIDEHTKYGGIFVDNKLVCYDEDLQSEEIEVIE